MAKQANEMYLGDNGRKISSPCGRELNAIRPNRCELAPLSPRAKTMRRTTIDDHTTKLCM